MRTAFKRNFTLEYFGIRPSKRLLAVWCAIAFPIRCELHFHFRAVDFTLDHFGIKASRPKVVHPNPKRAIFLLEGGRFQETFATPRFYEISTISQTTFPNVPKSKELRNRAAPYGMGLVHPGLNQRGVSIHRKTLLSPQRHVSPPIIPHYPRIGTKYSAISRRRLVLILGVRVSPT